MSNLQLSIEEWKSIPGYPKYEVSTHARVRNIKNKRIVKHWLRGRYYTIKLGANDCGNALHRLVALVFIPNPENKPFVNHKDLDTLNCYAYNLEWVTAKENAQHYHNTADKPIHIKIRLSELNTLYLQNPTMSLVDFIQLVGQIKDFHFELNH